jgi:hypothetical protein
MPTACKRCGAVVPSFSPMRKWCVECRRVVSLEQARVRRNGNRNAKQQTPKHQLRPVLKLNKM